MTDDWLSDHLPTAATFSKDPKLFARGFEPNGLDHGFAARVYDEQGGKYIDFISALGANLLGYPICVYDDASPAGKFATRLAHQIYRGAGFSLPHTLESQVADKLCQLLGTRVPTWSADKLGVRFGKTGSDACSMAVRLARAVTGRRRVLSSGYHGWGDEFVSMTPPAWGVTQPQYIENWDLNSLSWVDQLIGGEAVAAVIIEVPMTLLPDGFWSYVRELCDTSGTLLILDEVVTGLRWALGGAAEVYGIEPDIVCMGKALGNGLPISAIIGKREHFDWFARPDPVFISSTNFGDAVSLAAADAVLDIWNQAGVDHLWSIGRVLMDGLREIGFTVIGHPPRMLIQFPSLAHKTYFTLAMRDRGILWNRPTLPNLAHTITDVELTVRAAREIAAEMKRVDVAALMADKLPMVLFENR